jgi:hypothetical protein
VPPHHPDETEAEILLLLGSGRPFSYNEIVEHVGRRVSASSPKISRRLRHLVELGVVQRDITDDWPPRSLYSTGGSRSGIRPGGRKSFLLLVALMFSVILSSWAISIAVSFPPPGDGLLLKNFLFLSGPIVAGVFAGIRGRGILSSLYACLAAAGVVTVAWTVLLHLDYPPLEMLWVMLYVFSGLFLLESTGTIPALVACRIWRQMGPDHQGIPRLLQRIRDHLSM